MDDLLHLPGPGKATMLVEGLDHPEGVAWSPRSGAVYAGGEAGQIYRVALDDPQLAVIADVGGLVLGVAVDGRDRVVACVPGVHTVALIDGATVTTLASEAGGRRLEMPNYPAFGADGTLYFTDAGLWEGHNGRIVALEPGGELHVFSEFLNRFPNGLAVSPDGNWLWAVESLGPTVSRFDLRAPGRPPELMVRLHGHVPDGLAFTADGGVLISCYRPDRIYHLGADGHLTVVAQDPHGTLLGAPTNVCFVGDRLDRVVSANLQRWHLTLLDLGLSGAPVHYPERWAADAATASS